MSSTNPLTLVRETLQARFTASAPLRELVGEVYVFDAAAGEAGTGLDAERAARAWLVIGAPKVTADPFASNNSWELTRRYSLVMGLPERSWDLAGLEAIELAICQIVLAAQLDQLGIGGVTRVAMGESQYYGTIPDAVEGERVDPDSPMSIEWQGQVELTISLTHAEIAAGAFA